MLSDFVINCLYKILVSLCQSIILRMFNHLTIHSNYIPKSLTEEIFQSYFDIYSLKFLQKPSPISIKQTKTSLHRAQEWNSNLLVNTLWVVVLDTLFLLFYIFSVVLAVWYTHENISRVLDSLHSFLNNSNRYVFVKYHKFD